MITGTTYQVSMKETPNPMADLARARMRLFNEHFEACYQKYRRARKREVQRQWWNKYEHFHKLYTRYSDMYFRLRKVGNPFTIEHDALEELSRWKNRLKDKEARRQQFLQLHRYSMWYMSNSLRADYGRFKCDSCGYEFFHSPSTIRKAGKEVYHCCCGTCTNNIIQRDYKTNPYE